MRVVLFYVKKNMGVWKWDVEDAVPYRIVQYI